MGQLVSTPLLVFATVTLLMSACIDIDIDDDSDADTIVGSGALITETYDFAAFEDLRVSHAFELAVVQSDEFSVEVTVDDNLSDYVVVEVRGNALFVGLASGTSTRDTTQKAKVTMPRLRSIVGSGASQSRLEGFRSIDTLEVDLSGASRITADVGTNEMDLELSGASTATLSGTAVTATLDASGASIVELGDLEIQTATVDMSGASTGTVWVSEEIREIRLSGASTLSYRGQPVLGRVDVTGASRVSPE